MIDQLVLFGASGDLAGRLLLSALAERQAAGELPDGFRVLAAAREDWDDDAFRDHLAERLGEHAPDVPLAAREALLAACSYVPVDLDDPASVGRVLAAAADRPLAAYLALPPAAFPAALTSLAAAGLPAGSRIAVEKPFGEDLDSAVALNALVAEVVGDAGEPAVFRVDHALGTAAVQALLSRRTASPVSEDDGWDGAHLEQVDVLWEETLGLEGRADFYDRAGALKDVVQNHVLQVLCLAAMEPPAELSEQELRDRKVEVLRAVRVRDSRRARYTAAGDVPDYADEAGVDPDRGTETFAEVVLEVDTPRWAGTRFVLRAGKALDGRRRGLVAHRRADASTPLDEQLVVDVDGPDDGERAAYGRVLLDVLTGGSTLSVRGDEAEQAWRVLTPVLQAWAQDRVPLLHYAAGSPGPR